MESGRSKKVRSRRTPVAIWRVLCQERATFCEPGSTGCRSVTHPAHLGGPRAPHATAPFSHRGTRPSRRPSRTRRPTPRLPAPRKAYRRAPLRARQRPVVHPRQRPPRRYAPLCEHPPNIRRGVLRTAAPHHVPTRRPALRLKGRTLVPRLRQPPPPLALIELQSHPRRSDEIAIHPRIAEALPKFAFHPFQKRVNGVA